MKNKLLICFAVFISSQITFAQLQNNTWYFSPTSAGIQFNFVTNVPSVVTGHAPLTCVHGCGIASEPATGAVMFYTDALHVFDANNLQMPNGGALNGGVSCAEKGDIVQVPGSCKRFYVFSNNANSPTAGSLYYSIVNMNLPGNGTVAAPLGDVEVASLNTLVTANSTEAYTVAPNTNGNSYWLIVPLNNSSTINVYSITTGGIAFANTFNTGTSYNSSMAIKYSALAGKVAYCSVVELEPALIMDFNATTGVLSNATVIPNTPIGTCTNIYNGWHDLEFSPDGSKLYLSKYRMFTPASAGRIYQYDLSAPLTPITPVFINPTTNIQMTVTGLQTGPDGKIYFIYFNTTTGDDRVIGVINSPNLAGAACNVNATALNLGVAQAGNSRFSKPALFNTNPTITVSISGNTSVCPGQSATLIASGATTYQWSGGGINSTSDSIVVSPALTTQYFVTGTNTCGSAVDSIVVSINPAPTATITGNLNICSGQTTTLTASGATSYQWSGSSTATTAAITVSPGTTTTYTLTPTNGGCAGTSVIDTVNVTPSPVASIVSSANSICTGQSVTLTGSGGTTYQWSGGSTSNLAQIIDSPLVATSYTLQAINGSCTDTASVTITVNSVPVGAISGNSNICSGQSTTLTASGATSYQWSGGSTATTAAINVSPATTTTFTLTPSNGGCQGTSIIDTINVTPTPVASIVASGNSICPGQSVTLTGSGGTTYQWSGGSTAATAVISVTPAVTTTYSLQAINGTCTNSTSISIQANTLPVVLITGNQIICEGQSATLTASGATSYQWSGGSTSASASITVTPNVTTTYTVTGTNSCGTSSSTDIVSVNPSPVISILNPDVTIQNGASIQLEASGGVSYLWSNGSNLSCNTCFNPIVSPTVTTTYIVSGANSFGCLDTAKVTITLLPGDDELFIPNCITADGDGQNDIFYAYGINIKTLTMDIFDRWGELIFESKDKTKGWDAKYDGVKVPIGVYVYVVDCEWNDGNNTKRRGIVTVVR